MSWEELEERVREWERRMNPQQREAAEAIVKSWNEAGEEKFVFPIVNGPPGTGKTHVAAVGCAKYVLQGREEGEKPEVVYLCKTNFACERAKEVLFSLGFTFCPPGTTVPDVPLAARIKAGEQRFQWKDGVVGWDDAGKMDMDMLKVHHVLVATVHSAGKSYPLRGKTKIVVDEFSQVNAMDFFAAVERVCRGGGGLQGLALLGDPLQLPLVTTQSELRTNIFSWLQMRFHSRVLPRHELRRQYRMNEEICEGVNRIREEMGSYRLETAREVKRRRLQIELPGSLPKGIRRALDPDHPLVLVDTSGLGEERRGFGQAVGDRSVSNPGEAKLAARLAYEAMRLAGPRAVKVLTPYSAQERTIRGEMKRLAGEEGEEAVSTIWRAQGQEWPCVIVSLVRNNRGETPEKRWGFLGDEFLMAQIYVAASRAQSKLVVLASQETFREHRLVWALWETPGALHMGGEELR